MKSQSALLSVKQAALSPEREWGHAAVHPLPDREPLLAEHQVPPVNGHDFSRVPVRAAAPMLLQAKLAVGQPGDRFEQEADLIADRLMRSTTLTDERAQPAAVSRGSTSVQRAPEEAAGPAPEDEAGPSKEGVEESAAEEEAPVTPEQVAMMLLESDDLEGEPEEEAGEEEPADSEPSPAGAPEGETVQARALPGQTPGVTSGQATRIHALRGRGQPLPNSSRAFFEPRFGHDLGYVRIHTGTEAGRLARSVQAKAFTVGHEVVFGEGRYQPGSSTGQRLMAHELVHVLQQQAGPSRAPAGALQVQPTGRLQLQGGFFSSLWGGIKKGASAVWGGIKKGASALWSGIKKGASALWGGIKKGARAAWKGIKWVAGKVWSGLKAGGRWAWNVLKSGAALAWSQVVNLPGRVWRLIKHLGSGIAGTVSWLWEGLKLAWHLDFKGLGKWLVDGFLSGAAWVGRLIGKLVDIAGIGEVWDLLSQIIKFNTRPLTSTEKSEAQKTFKGSISYWQVRVDEYSLISAIGAAFKGGGGMGVTTFHTVNFNRKVKATPGSGDMHWLTHELTHVSQYEHAGSQYLGEAIHAQASVGYDYKGPGALWRPAGHASPNPAGKHFRQFNREQQADIAADYYFSLYGKTIPSGKFTPITAEYEPVVDELRAGDM